MGGGESYRLGRGGVSRFSVHFMVQRAIGSTVSIVACRPVTRQRPRNKRVYNSRCLVRAPSTDANATIPRQQLHCNRGVNEELVRGLAAVQSL
jgi:hypothetical protein